MWVYLMGCSRCALKILLSQVIEDVILPPIVVPTQRLVWNQGYEYSLVPDAGVHYQIGDGSSPVPAFAVNYSVPVNSPGCAMQVWAEGHGVRYLRIFGLKAILRLV
jgi:hypothetical protein